MLIITRFKEKELHKISKYGFSIEGALNKIKK